MMTQVNPFSKEHSATFYDVVSSPLSPIPDLLLHPGQTRRVEAGRIGCGAVGLEQHLLHAGADVLATRHELLVKMLWLRGEGYAVTGFTDCLAAYVFIRHLGLNVADN